MKRCKGQASSLDSQATHHLWRNAKLESICILFLTWLVQTKHAWCVHVVHASAQRTRTHSWSAWAHHCPEHAVRARTQQHTRQVALRIPCAKAELRSCKQGCIKPGRGASQKVDPTLLNLPKDPTLPLTSPLDPACDAPVILMLTWEKHPVALPPPRKKNLWA